MISFNGGHWHDLTMSRVDTTPADFLDRVARRVDGGAVDLRNDDARCPWCDDAIDAEKLCSRRCHSSRVNRTDDR